MKNVLTGALGDGGLQQILEAAQHLKGVEWFQSVFEQLFFERKSKKIGIRKAFTKKKIMDTSNLLFIN